MSAAETALTEKNNSNVSSPQSAKRKWLADVFVIVFCVSGAAFSLNMFRLDLFQSLASQNKKPMGTVTIKYNNVQRRFSDRVLWSRLTVDSPVYLGDLIRVAEYSAATLNINDGVIDINENSLIRIRASSDGEARIVIDLNSGSLSITGSDSADGGVALNVMGRIVAPTAKGTLSVLAGESGITLQVNEGSAIITGEDGQSRSMDAGEALILNNQGVEQAAPMAVVMMPRPNARFIKNSVEPLNIRFTWNVINIDQQQPLRLEIAAGPNFTRIVRTAEGVNFSNVALGAGTWYWRLSYQDTVLSSGQFTIVDAAISSSTSPLKDSIDYRENMPIRFEWQSIEEASYYILEASLTPDIKNPLITRQTAIAFYVETSMKAGDWYWRVKPVFSSVYEGTTVFSQVASFRIEKNEEPAAVVQTADDSAIMPTQPEAETKSADNSKTKKSDKSTNPAKPADSAASDNLVNPVTPPVSDTATLADPISDTDIFILPTAGWKTITDNNGSRSNINIAGEIIDGKEINVLTISSILAGGTSRWTGATLTEENFITKVLHLYSRTTGTTAADIILIQKLANANGVRFKILGDGKKWEVYFPTTDVNDGAYHGLTISTQNGEVSNIDVPFNKLTQPSYGMRIRFNKNKLKGITIQKSDNIGSGTAASTIKIFDFEVY